MRKNWMTAALAAAGLTMGGAGVANAWPNIGGGSPQPAPGQFAPVPGGTPGAYGQPSAQPTWTQRVLAPFKSSTPPLVAPNQPNPADVARRQELDPISLGYNVSPGSPDLYVAMAEMSHRGGNVPQARELYKKALSTDPKNVNALLGAARMEDREGQLDVALGLYHRAIAAQPKNPTALNDLALCLARKGDLPSAYRAMQDTIKLDPRKPLYRNNIAKVLIELNRIDEAAWNLASVHPPAVVQYNMGVLLCQRGRNGEAAQFLSRAVAIDPNMQPARVLLSQLTTPAAPMVANNVPQQPIVRTAQGPMPAATTTQQPTTPPANLVTPDNSILPTPSTGAEAAAAPQSAVPATPAPTAVGANTATESTPLAVLPSRLPAVN